MRIDDAITNYPKATLKSLSKPVAMAFNRLKQTVKKDMKDDAFAAMIEEFRKNPIEEEEEVEEGGEGGRSLAVQVQPSWKESRQRRWRE